MTVSTRGAAAAAAQRRRARRHGRPRRGRPHRRVQRRSVGVDVGVVARGAARAGRRRTSPRPRRTGSRRRARPRGSTRRATRGPRSCSRASGSSDGSPRSCAARSTRSSPTGGRRIPGPHAPRPRRARRRRRRAPHRLRPGAARQAARRGLDAAGRLARGGARRPGRGLPGPRGATGASRSCSGAGNVGSLGPNDVLNKLFVAGKVVVLKANPVNDYLVEHWERALRALIDEGVLRIVRGGAAAGSHLVAHSLVDEVHVTGSDKTYEAIVFGPGDEGARRKAAGVRRRDQAGDRRARQRLTGHRRARRLVGEGPLLPGGPRGVDARQQRGVQLPHAAAARHLEALAAARGVPQRARVRALRDPDARSRTTRVPTSATRASSPRTRDARLLGSDEDGRLPWTVLRGIDAQDRRDVALNVEAFCSLMAETAIDTVTPDQFVDAAVELCNDVVWGSLSATILAHPDQLARLARRRADRRGGRVAALRRRSGSTCGTRWPTRSRTTTWGAYPGHPATDIQSGTGVVGNALMFDRPQKSVVTGPFRASPVPATFATSSAAARRPAGSWTSCSTRRRQAAGTPGIRAALTPGAYRSDERHRARRRDRRALRRRRAGDRDDRVRHVAERQRPWGAGSAARR